MSTTRDTAPAPDLAALLAAAEADVSDIDFESVRRWKAEAPGRRAIGYLPVWAPREIIRAAGMLPVGVFGGGDRIEIIRGDACFQSYICHLPRSTVELGLSGRLDVLDGLLFPATCDVIRNLGGIWKLLLPRVPTRYIDVPQCDDTAVGVRFFAAELRSLAADLEKLGGAAVTDEALREAIVAYNANRERLRALAELRRTHPHLAPASEAYLMERAGCLLPVEEHTRMIEAYLQAAANSGRREMDSCRVVVRGAFCEQPPLGLVRTLERAGCDIVDDDFVLIGRWHRRDIGTEGDPFEALARAFLEDSVPTASRWSGRQRKGEDLVTAVRDSGAGGVIFISASFCDPALLDQPMLAAALDRAGIPYTAFKYSEETAQFQAIREQAGTFADSIRLWSETA
jgi:benzoyl-CoA reductase subunit C